MFNKRKSNQYGSGPEFRQILVIPVKKVDEYRKANKN